ncbi:MAG: magnesium/cobalt transporter CorA, partial [Planctomycetota bacterium]
IVPPPAAPAPQLAMRRYDTDHHEACDDCDLAAIRDWRGGDRRLWVDVTGVGDAELLRALGEEFDIHPLVMEDVAHLGQRPKIELYDGVLLIVLYHIELDPHPVLEQVSVILGPTWVVSFQERMGDPFEPVRQRLTTTSTAVRRRGADFLAYALVDAIIDHYFHVIEELSARLDGIEDEIFELAASLPPRIRTLKRELIEIRRSLRPLLEALAILHREPLPLIETETRLFLRDCYDHVTQVLDQVDHAHDIATDQLATFLNLASHRQAQITEVLTVIATIFLPLTFVAGVYGMNFDTSHPWNMPELGWRYGYPAVMAFMLLVAIGMLVIFRRKGWIGGRRR